MDAISIPGVILSQLLMQTIASALWAFTIYSTLSAIISREGSELEHSVVSHSDTIVNGNRIEFGSKATQLFNLRFYLLPDLMQMDMAGTNW